MDKEYYAHVGSHHLKCLKLDVDSWIKLMSFDSVFADELMIFALSKIYNRHTIIFTSNACWTIIGTDTPITGSCLLEICDIHLLYIGVHMFAELKRKPFIPITATAVLESLQVKIPILDTEDTAALAIDLSVKQKEGPVDSGKYSESKDPPSAPNDNQIATSPSTTEKLGSSSIPSEADKDSYKQQAVDSNIPGSEPITHVFTDSSSISDSLLSPNC